MTTAYSPVPVIIFVAAFGFGCVNCGDSGPAEVRDADLPPVDPLDPDPGFDEGFQGHGNEATVTTVVQTLRPRYDPTEPFVDRWGRLRVPPEEIGRDYPQHGEPHLDRDELGAGGSTTGPDRKSVLYFVLLADAQLVDVQSPAHAPSSERSTIMDLPAFHAAGPLFPHLLDAQIQTALQFSTARTFDFFVHAGDAIENAQENELEWFVTIMDGGTVQPDSGEADDPVPGPGNDALDPFVAQGVPASVPWYAVIGNHDLNVFGIYPPGFVLEANQPEFYDRVQAGMDTFGLTLPGVPTSTWAPSVVPTEHNPAFTATADTFSPELVPTLDDILGFGGAEVAADPGRQFVDPCRYIDAHFTGGNPDGHGFTQQSRTTCNGWYVAEPVAGYPFRLIVLDLGPHIGGYKGSITPPLNPDGTVDTGRVGNPDHDQWAFLQQELDRAQTDEVAVIVASHHPSSVMDDANSMGAVGMLMFPDDPDIAALWERHFIEPAEGRDGADLRSLLTSYPNVIVHLVGHSHKNRVVAVCSDGSTVKTDEVEGQGKRCPPPSGGLTAANGYWEVMSGGGRSYPHHFRIIEIVDNGDGTGSVYLTCVNPQGGDGSLSHYGRLLGLAGDQLEGDDSVSHKGLLLDRNVELRFEWSQPVAARVAQLAAPTEIESLTTLYQPQPGLPSLPVWP
jgi:hypothetical protein